ncbi:hypothetical protein HK096_008512 [Nowakowskiella sp. JEL0078]|nr:hypothetical protein HK096_008512 [Nowakowskiella sp. JEL0078]
MEAIGEINSIFKQNGLKVISQEILKTIKAGESVNSSHRRWWTVWRKEQENSGNVMATHLTKSLEYASAPFSEGDSRQVPILVQQCVCHLRANGMKSTGVFRVNGSEKRINLLALHFDTPPSYGMNTDFSGYNINDVAGVLKKFLRNLPEPVFPTFLYPYFIQCLNVPIFDGQRIRACRLMAMLLPKQHLFLLEYLLSFFADVAQNSAHNSMTSNNLARILGSNFLRSKQSKQPIDDYEKCARIFEIFLEHNEQLVITSPDLRPFELLTATYLFTRKNSTVSMIQQAHPMQSNSNFTLHSLNDSYVSLPAPINIEAIGLPRTMSQPGPLFLMSSTSTPAPETTPGLVTNIKSTSDGSSTITTITTKITTQNQPIHRSSVASTTSSRSRSDSHYSKDSKGSIQQSILVTTTSDIDGNHVQRSISSKSKRSIVSEHLLVMQIPVSQILEVYDTTYNESHGVERHSSVATNGTKKEGALRRVRTAPAKRERVKNDSGDHSQHSSVTHTPSPLPTEE